MSVKNTCALRLGGGGLINSPVSDNLHPLDISTEYVSGFLKKSDTHDSYLCVF